MLSVRFSLIGFLLLNAGQAQYVSSINICLFTVAYSAKFYITNIGRAFNAHIYRI